MSDAVLEKLLGLETELSELRVRVLQQDKTIKGMKHWLQVAADYKNESPERVAEAIQHALGRAAQYEKPVRTIRKRKGN